MLVRKVVDRVDVRCMFWFLRCGFGLVCDCEDLKSSLLIDRKFNRLEIGKECGGLWWSKIFVESDSLLCILFYRCILDEYSYVCV